jgi:hypothetical protein
MIIGGNKAFQKVTQAPRGRAKEKIHETKEAMELTTIGTVRPTCMARPYQVSVALSRHIFWIRFPRHGGIEKSLNLTSKRDMEGEYTEGN